MPIRLLIADDHTVVRQGLMLLLAAQTDIEVVGEAADGAETLCLMDKLKPDVILLDLIMPGMSGLETLRELREKHEAARIVVLTSSVEDHMITQALRTGAHGYLLKTNRAADMLQAIRQVAQGFSAFDPAVTQTLQKQMGGKDVLDTLTPRERDVFNLLAHGMNNFQIAETLVVSEATVRTHVISVLDKLSLRDRTQVMVFALKRGLVQPHDLP